jgi:O-antigen/teichoic acid export membrane protein
MWHILSGEPGGGEKGRDDARIVARGSAVLFAAQVVGNAGFFAAVLMLARGLGPSGRGAVAFFVVTAMVAARASGLGVREATTVLAAQRPQERPVLLTNVALAGVASGLGAGAVVCGGLVLLAGVRPAGIGALELAFLGLGILAVALIDSGYSFLLGCSRFRIQALVTAGSSWIYAAALLVIWVASGLTVTSAVVAWTAGQLLRAGFLLRASARFVGLGRPNRRLLREAVGYGARVWIGSLARFTNFRADQMLMGFIASEASLGIYAVAVNASEVLLYLPEATAMALLPMVARIDPARRAEQALQAFRSLLVITAGGILVAVLVGSPLLPVVFGGKFDASTGPFLWLLPGAIGYVALGVFSNTLVASAPSLSSLGPLVSLVSGLALDIVLIPLFGANGAGAAASTAFILGGATAVIAYRRRAYFPWKALVVPARGDLDLLRALLRLPFSLRHRSAPASDAAAFGGR